MINVYTEEEAKKITCCNKVGRCVASGCMAWRWAGGLSDYIHPEDALDGIGRESMEQGYCGLAGKPC